MIYWYAKVSNIGNKIHFLRNTCLLHSFRIQPLLSTTATNKTQKSPKITTFYEKKHMGNAELQTRELLKCLWHFEKTTWRACRCRQCHLLRTLRGSALIAAGGWQRGSAGETASLWVPGVFQGVPDKGDMCPTHNSKIHYLSVKKSSRSSHRTGSYSQKVIRGKLQSVSKTTHIPSGQRPSDQSSVMGWGGAVY